MPGLDDRRPECPPFHYPELYEYRRETSEVLDVKEPIGRIHQQHVLLLEVLDPDRDQWTLRRRFDAEPFQVSFAERPLPGEGLAGDEPGAVAKAHAFGDLGQRKGYLGGIVDSHLSTVPVAVLATSRLVPPEGLEPPTRGLGNRCSIP